VLDDPAEVSVHTRDPDDDYLVALAGHAQAILVSGDRDLLDATLPEITVL
jgi:predicted nucleic acid-binding protein